MDLLKSKRKIEALAILEKLKNHHHSEVLSKFKASADLKSKLGSKESSLSQLLISTEEDIQSSTLGEIKIGVDVLMMKYSYLDSLHVALNETKKNLHDVNNEFEKLKEDLIMADAKKTIVEEKHRHEITLYQNAINARCEA